MSEPSAQQQREGMVCVIDARGVSDPRVLEAMRAVPRERFVDAGWESHAYDDSALPISAGQTISQPYVVALMAAALDLSPSSRALEVGTGSGYAAAVLSGLCAEVQSVERQRALAEVASDRLARLGYRNVHVHHADGMNGWPTAAPYDAISVAAAAPEVPAALIEQLREGGVLVMPVGDDQAQRLLRVRKLHDGFSTEVLAEVRFVPLLEAMA